MTIVKTMISMTVLLPEHEVEMLQNASLSAIEYHVTSGSWIAGRIDRGVPTVVPEGELQDMLRAIQHEDSCFDVTEADAQMFSDED